MSDLNYHPLLGRLLAASIEIQQLRHEKFSPGFMQRSQMIPSFRLIFICSGVMDYSVEKSTQKFNAGSALLVPPWIWRDWRVLGRKSLEITWAVFDAKEQQVSGSLHRVLSSRPNSFDLIRDRMLKLCELKEQFSLDDIRVHSDFRAVLAHFICDEDTHRGLEHLSTTTQSARHPHVDTVVNYLQQRYTVPSVLSEISEVVPLHPDYLRDLFRRQMHMSPQQYLTMLRMRAARYCLVSTNETVKQVSYRVGFRDPQYFSRVYRKFWNHSPGQERAN